jgi:predicted Zn-ribbon and HTH transcriptional regulator
MVEQILTEFEKADTVMCLEEIAQRIGKDSRVVDGVMETLIRMGKVIEIKSTLCSSCPLHATCKSNSISGRAFTLAT